MAKVIRAARHAIALDASLHVNTTQATPLYPRECTSSLTHLPSFEHQSRQRLLGLRVGEAHDEITRQRVALDVVAKFENVTYIGLGAAAPATTGRPWRTPTLPTARPRSQGSPNYSLLRKWLPTLSDAPTDAPPQSRLGLRPRRPGYMPSSRFTTPRAVQGP